MVDSVNGVNAVSNATYDITFEELDVNNDGKVDKTDYDMLAGYITDDDESNDVNISKDDLDKIFENVLNGEETELEDCPDCKPSDEVTDETTADEEKAEASTEITLDNVNDKAAAYLADTTRTAVDPTKATTAEELQAIKDQLTSQIAEYDAVEKVLLEKIEKLQDTLTAISNEVEDEEKDYTNTENEVDKKSDEVEEKVDDAEAKAEDAVEETKDESNKTAAQCLEDYKAGKYGDESLQSVLTRELSLKVSSNATDAAEDEVAEAEALSTEVAELADNLTDIAENIEDLKSKADSQTTELNSTITNRDSILAARQADSDKFQATYDVTFETEEPTPETTSKCCDPMSFTKDNIKYDFIQDRDNDGVFDDATEFLGAKNGWDEMKAYDTDGDGTIKGDELKDLKMVGVDQKTGKYTFTTAAEAGVTSIDLSTYSADGSTKKTGDTLEGTFKVNIGGEEVAAEQTTDTEINLQNKYGELFGKDIKDYNETYETNPFQSAFETNIAAAAQTAKAAGDAVDDAADAVDDAADDAEGAVDNVVDDAKGVQITNDDETVDPEATDDNADTSNIEVETNPNADEGEVTVIDDQKASTKIQK